MGIELMVCSFFDISYVYVNKIYRNYYRCSSGGCQVKKRIERDTEDPSYVITTYTGIHNHPIPGVGH